MKQPWTSQKLNLDEMDEDFADGLLPICIKKYQQKESKSWSYQGAFNNTLISSQKWLALDRGYIKSHSASLDDPFNPSQFQKCLGIRATLAGLFSFFLSSSHIFIIFLFLFLFEFGLFLYSLVIAKKSRGSGGRETLLAEEKPSLRTVKADPYQNSLHLSFSFLFPQSLFWVLIAEFDCLSSFEPVKEL
ncbi:hypothetical protein IGI04_030500 [Brassica rapa subsp. trilocularis]|uniref:Calpain catalytic domain-containing protein n=1 Tax=Brassica rapa subsp. trilocularis TaxID=1813537 RepID=A0ABQ7LQY1_BRACM|nr:hypothetical protein IGI04_030500 [Brassica rapa subsp. trilocularis]